MENKEKVSKKVVISASAFQTEAIEEWKKYWEDKRFEIINYPIGIKTDDFLNVWPKVHEDFLNSKNVVENKE